MVVTQRYMITNGKGAFLIDLYHGTAKWSNNPHDCMRTGHAWLESDRANEKRKEAQKAAGVPLSLLQVTLSKKPEDYYWQLAKQAPASL
jgi:hypothetical protein